MTIEDEILLTLAKIKVHLRRMKRPIIHYTDDDIRGKKKKPIRAGDTVYLVDKKNKVPYRRMMVSKDTWFCPDYAFLLTKADADLTIYFLKYQKLKL